MLLRKIALTLALSTIPLCAQNTETSKKKALIFGVTGQDGAYLTEFLLNKDYEVHGVKRKSSMLNTGRIDKFYEDPQHCKNFNLHYGDLTDASNVVHLLQYVQPDEVYNLAAQSHVKVSFELPNYTSQRFEHFGGD